MNYGKIAVVCFGVALAGIAWAQSPNDNMDHSKMDHAAMGHGARAPAAGPWSYKGRDNPAPYKQGRWDMVPVPQYGHMFVSVEKLSPELRCAALRDNPGVMVDRATRQACNSPDRVAPATAPAPVSTDMADAGMHDHRTMTMPHGHWMAPADALQRKNPIPATAESIERGRRLYQTNCVSCHGATGKGDGPVAATLNPRPANLQAMAGSHPDGDYAWKIANGRGPMPAWKGTLSENHIWDLVNFIQRLGKAEADGDPPQHDQSHRH